MNEPQANPTRRFLVKRFSFLGAAALLALLLVGPSPAAAAPPAGPPYPAAVDGQRVYDYAGIFSAGARAEAEQIIAAIQERTGAQIAVYTQLKPESDTLELANADARALMDHWGVGRKGFDDGLVIMFDMNASLRHGQVSLYAGAGYRAAFLSDEERQAIFDNDMKPFLAAGDMDGGLLAGLNDINDNATPEHANALERGRQTNALFLLGAMLIGVFLVLAAFVSWLLHGRDPVYIDDNSVLMPAPPGGLSPAMATILLDDRSSDRTVTAGLLDLAAHGAIAFKQEHRQIKGNPVRAGITHLGSGNGSLDKPESKLLDGIVDRSRKYDDYIAASRLYRLSGSFETFRSDLETAAVDEGWLTEQPGKVVSRWAWRGGLEITAAIVSGFVWFIFLTGGVFMSALFMLTASLAFAGVVTYILSRFMPARTHQGAILYAMLSAYKRTLATTMAQAHSMTYVVKQRALPWIQTPDEAMCWGIAFGLNAEIEEVLTRTMTDSSEQIPDASDRWYPGWWTMAGSSGVHGAGGHSGGSVGFSSSSAGLFSSSPFPDPGAIVAALGSIASSPSPVSSGGSSSSSFSSGSFGGGGGGGGGGAGGGF
jgi:uncharacterized membrane protein YgcG